jgi:glycosyltransferase involved in cell wall biosynthesis
MKVLLINSSDGVGGAAIAASRLHYGLLAQGVDSRLLVGACHASSDRVAVIHRNHRLEMLIGRLTWQLGFNDFNIISSFDIPKHPFYQEADILNFHNLHGGYFNYLALPELTKQKPAILTLHDMWSFTGHCVYSYDCDRWKQGCGQCPYPDTYPSIRRDSTHLEWRLKRWIYSRSNLFVVTLSQWLTEQAKHSILNQLPIYHIPNGIDTTAYQPLAPDLCRAALGIPPQQKVLMFAAQNLTDPRKGGYLLVEALQNLPQSLKTEILLLVLGDGGTDIAQATGIKTLDLGYISSDRLKSIAYSAADLFVFPTRADNLPLVLQESMACGTPMVSFKVGGVPDLVRPGITGYLAEADNAQDFCDGVVQLLEDSSLRKQMGFHCREIATQDYSIELQASRYIELYQILLKHQ